MGVRTLVAGAFAGQLWLTVALRIHGVLPQADWNIVKRGWDAHVLGKAPFKFTDPVEAIKSLRVRGGGGWAAGTTRQRCLAAGARHHQQKGSTSACLDDSTA